MKYREIPWLSKEMILLQSFPWSKKLYVCISVLIIRMLNTAKTCSVLYKWYRAVEIYFLSVAVGETRSIL